MQDVIGKRFGRLVVVEESLPRTNIRKFHCKCDCGSTTVTGLADLNRGHSTSCGCYRRERSSVVAKSMRTTHGLSNTPTYITWHNMMARCHNPTHVRFADYGGRGIFVCTRWHKFENFLADMGFRPDGTSIDRRNNNKGYSKSNCYWATESEQQRNKRNIAKHSLSGEMLSVRELAERFSIDRRVIQARLKLGWSVHDAVTLKPDRHRKYKSRESN